MVIGTKTFKFEQLANRMHHLNESETRYNLIDPLLQKAGWNLADRRSVGFEIPVDGYDAAPVNGITDYCLFREMEKCSPL